MVHSASLPRNAAKLLVALLAAGTLLASEPVLSAEPGGSFTEHCPTGWESVTVTRTEVSGICAPSASSTPGPTPTLSPIPTNSPSASPTSSPTAAATPTVAPTATPSPVPSPTSSPTPPSTDCDTITGYGSGATGGTNLVTATSPSQVASLVGQSGNRVILGGGGVWDLNGARLNVASNVTIVDDAQPTVIKDAWFLVRSDNVIFDGFTIATGDESVSVDSDPISLNGASNVAINRMTLLWGMDVGGLTILNASTDVTVQCSIIGEGLYRSKHPEAGDGNGHSYALNIAGLSTSAVPERITVYRNLLTTSHSRMPRIHGARLVDVVNNVIYNGSNGPEGTPASLNYVGNYLRPGPASAGVGISDANFYCVWRTQTGGVFGSVVPGSVYETGNVLEGTRRNCMTASQRASTAFPLSVTPEPASLDVLDDVGSGPYRDRLINNVRNGAGQFLNGVNGPAPAIAW